MNMLRAAAEWRRAQEGLTATRLCQSNGLYANAISSAYFSVMHGAKAGLELRDVTARTHKGVGKMFSLHLVRAGIIESEWGALIGQLYKLRIAADYDIEEVFNEPDARSAYNRAQAFLNRMQPILTDSIPLQEPGAPP